MPYNKNLMSLCSEANKRRNIGNKINTYRQCANIPFNRLAERCGVSTEILDAVERGLYQSLTIPLILRFAEELGVSYADLYEDDNEKYYSNVKDDSAFKFIFDKAQDYTFKRLAEQLEVKENYIYNVRYKNYIPSPFVLANVMTLLNIKSVDFRNAERAKNTTETKEETTAPDVDALNEVIKAVNVYKNVDTLKAELNEIISKAQNLLNMLGA